MSVQRSFAQRKNNVVNLVPEMATSGYWDGSYLLKVDPTNCSVFNVDLSGLDATPYDINSIDSYGRIRNTNGVDVIWFAVIVDPTIAALYPGLEYTVNFLRGSANSDICINVHPIATLNDSAASDMLSPQRVFRSNHIQSLTMKSNGTTFAVISSGPSLWSINYWC